MAKYLLIESRDPFENNIVARQYDLAVNLVKEGNDVTLFLVQNGVLPARLSERSALLTNATKGGSRSAGGRILAARARHRGRQARRGRAGGASERRHRSARRRS